MKYLLLFLLALLIAWQWRTYRSKKYKEPRAGSPELPIEMVACRHCGTHVAAQEATQGPDGVYCSAAHRRLHES
jgi:uncharacterized protein